MDAFTIPMKNKYSSSFTQRELLEILISVLAISLALTLATGGATIQERIFQSPEIFTYHFLLFLFAVSPGFVLHEMGHKFTAIKFGCFAQFRAWVFGLVFMFLIGIFAGFIFAAPGAVYIMAPYLTKKERGLIASAGAFVNLIIALIGLGGAFLLLSLGTPGALEMELQALFETRALFSLGFWLQVLFFTAFINAFLAAFNMVPMHPLDGGKVINWSFGVWGSTILVSFGILAALGVFEAITFILMLMAFGFLFRSFFGGRRHGGF